MVEEASAGAAVAVAADVFYYLLVIYFLTLWARFALDLARAFLRGWRPRGAGLVAAETVYAVTDPPIKMFRRVLPPVRFGAIGLDFAWPLTLLATLVCMYLAQAFI